MQPRLAIQASAAASRGTTSSALRPDGNRICATSSQSGRLAITTSGLFNLSVGKIRNFVVPVPPLAEQFRIVSRVNELRRLCASLRERLVAEQTTRMHLADALVKSATTA